MTEQAEEKYLTAKEMAAELNERGMTVSAQFVRLLWKEGAPHVGRFGRVKALLEWWEANPDVQPFAKRNSGSGVRTL